MHENSTQHFELDEVNRKRTHYFDSNYQLLAHQSMQGDTPIYLGNKLNRQCKYCGKKSPEVKFQMLAHAFPEAIGNRWLIDCWECDTCNELFSRVIEDDLGKFLLPQRTLSGIRGKKGIPTYKTKDGKTRIESKSNVIKISAREGGNDVVVDEVKKSIVFHLVRQPYTPMGVFKCFVKMALAVMPATELKLCKHLVKWISEEQHTKESFPFYPLLVFTQFIPGLVLNDAIVYYLLRRKETVLDAPFMQFAIQIHNTIYQICLPMPEQDKAFLNKSIHIEHIFNPYLNWHEAIYGDVSYSIEDLTSPLVFRDDTGKINMSFETAIENTL